MPTCPPPSRFRLAHALLLAVIAAILGGCFVLPRTTRTTRVVGTTEAQATPGPIMATVVTTRVDQGEVSLRAVHRHQCRREILEVLEVTVARSVRLGGTDDPRGLAFGALLAPLTIPISGVITGLHVLTHRDETHRRTRPHSAVTFACTMPASNLQVTLTYPSGLSLQQVTDAGGIAAIRVPDSEPDRGEVTVSAPTITPQTASYRRRSPAVLAARAAVRICAERHRLADPVVVRLTTSVTGLVTQVRPDAGDASFATCIGTGIGRVPFGEAYRGRTLVVRHDPRGRAAASAAPEAHGAAPR